MKEMVVRFHFLEKGKSGDRVMEVILVAPGFNN